MSQLATLSGNGNPNGQIFGYAYQGYQDTATGNFWSRGETNPGTNGWTLVFSPSSGGGGAPSGPASGDLTGTYPAPTIKQNVQLFSGPNLVVDVGSLELIDGVGNPSIGWNGRVLVDTTGNISVDWENKTLNSEFAGYDLSITGTNNGTDGSGLVFPDTLNTSLSINGALNLTAAGLSVTGASEFDNDLTVDGGLSVANASQFTSSLRIGGALIFPNLLPSSDPNVAGQFYSGVGGAVFESQG